MAIQDFINTMLQVDSIRRQRAQDALAAQSQRQQQLTAGMTLLANAPKEARGVIIPLLSRTGVGSVEELSAAASVMPESTQQIISRGIEKGVQEGGITPSDIALHAILGTTQFGRAMDIAGATLPTATLKQGQTNALGTTMTAAQSESNQRAKEQEALQADATKANLLIAGARNRLDWAQLGQQYSLTMAQMQNDLLKFQLTQGKHETLDKTYEEIGRLGSYMQANAMPIEGQMVFRAPMAQHFRNAAAQIAQSNPTAAKRMIELANQLEDPNTNFQSGAWARGGK